MYEIVLEYTLIISWRYQYMSTRIGIVLDDETYKKYKEYLFKNNKTIQKDLEEVIKKKLQNNEQ